MENSKARRFFGRLGELARSLYARRVLTLGASFLSGLLSARGLVFGRYAPFGVAAVAAVPREGLWAAALGALFGYLLPSPVYVSVRYMAAVLAVSAIRWSLAELRSVRSHPLFPAAVSLIPLLLTGMTMVFLSGSVNYTAALYVAESFLGAGVAYFLGRTCRLLSGLTADGEPRAPGLLDSGDLAALAVSAGVLLLSFSEFSVAGVSLGRVLLALLVLYCARMGGVSGGAIAGVTAGAVQGLSTAGLSALSGAFGLGGLMAGVFSPMGKAACAIAFVLSYGVASLQSGGGTDQLLSAAIEVAISTLLYMVLPQSRYLEELLGVRRETLSGGALRDNIVLRLRHASGALSEVYESVNEVSEKLSVICAPNVQGVYDRAVETVCAGCAGRTSCWQKHAAETQENFSHLAEIFREKGKVELSDFTKPFSERCSRAGEMREELNKNYQRYLMKEAAELRAAQVRDAAERHFLTTAGILDEMAGEFSLYQHFDEEAAQRVRDVLRDNGVEPIEVCCRLDAHGRMTVEAELRKRRQKHLNRAVFTKEISAACGRVFSPPCVSSMEDRCRIQMCQRPAYEVGRGFSQRSAGGGAFCGDSSAVFTDGSGRLIALLSDGMGTGGRAAVDGAMTCAMAESLLKAGIGFDSMLQTVNSALMAKSGDESLATLDLCSIDLFTGEAEFRKAGAACTVLRRGRHAEVIESESIPLGILPEAAFVTTRRELSAGDVVLLVSDGVAVTGSGWLCDLVLDWDEEQNPNHLAEQVIEEAKKRRSDGHEDDVTAMVLVMN